MNIGLFDSHAHYFDRRFDEVGGGDKVLTDEVFCGNVSYVINVGTNDVTNRLCIEQAKKYDGMYAAVGIHPEDVRDLDDTLSAELDKLALLLGDRNTQRENKIVALGEIGLDYHYEDSDYKKQMDFFVKQMELAKRLDIPVIIHDRDAHGDCMDVIRRFPEVTGIFHSYSGSAEMARELIERGWYISFSGPITYKNAKKPKEACAICPLDRILIETDAPYLPPTPYRGQMNHPCYVIKTVEEIASIKGLTPEEIANITYENAKKVYRIK